ncbi:hypothetical protein Pth03_78050 [Planotetraspora thailandica]|uniref:TraD/TraG TraM recognition site domain-containing protein n=1 Tax=Planotetraspora thailandica TaxID=487172 RepID=A0A8J4DFE1_9ACTN|nr:TraM recognition domain-containing protein [Planotetraspora thailandica]GII59416.1 hypothetical protein Pth03_78050 [Planotetraspora thailandica]
MNVSAATADLALPGISTGFLVTLAVVLLGGIAVRMAWESARRGHQRPRAGLWRRVRMRRHPGAGFAGRWELWRRYGLQRARKVARHARPSLERRDLYGYRAWPQYATFLGWSQGWVHRWRCYGTLHDIRLTIAPPQKGKSSAAAGAIIDAPGPVVVTSIRGDLIKNTAGLRQRVGTLHVFNPEGVGEYGSTFRWNPVAGCEDPETAIRRAGYMVEAVETRGLSESNFWSNQAVRVLSAYMHAAGLVAGSMRHVYKWLTEEDYTPVEILSRHTMAAPFAADVVRRFLNLNDRTRDSIQATCDQVMSFMLSPEVVETLTPRGEGDEFDIRSFLRSRDTLYLVASSEAGSPVPPLLCALLAELKHEAVIAGAASPAGRLDPPLSLELDEVANVTPIPVHVWASYAAGSGIRLAMYSQSWAQLVARWGEKGAETIWQTAGAKVIMAGASEPDLLTRVSQLCGKVYIKVRDHRERDGTKTPVQDYVDVMAPGDVRRLPPGRAILILDAALPTIIRTEQVWKRADVKAWAKSGEPIRLPRVVEREIAIPEPGLLLGHRHTDELASRRRPIEPEQEAAPPLPRRPAIGDPSAPRAPRPWDAVPDPGES